MMAGAKEIARKSPPGGWKVYAAGAADVQARYPNAL